MWIAFNRYQLSVFVKNLLPASHRTVWTYRPRHLRVVIFRTQISRILAHRLGTGAIATLKSLPHHRPLHRQFFNHSNLHTAISAHTGANRRLKRWDAIASAL